MAKVQVSQRIPTLADVAQLLEKGFIPLCLINSAALAGKSGYTGHTVVITGIDDAKLVMHDPGLPPVSLQVVDFFSSNRRGHSQMNEQKILWRSENK